VTDTGRYSFRSSPLLDFRKLLLLIEYRWHAQVLGTESEATRTWLWAWANEGSNIPAPLLQASLQLKALGEAQEILELAQPQLPLGEVNGHFFLMIASGVCQANAYFRAPYEGGAAFLLIKDETFPKHADPPLQRIATIFPQAIASIEIPDHKLALMGHLEYYGLPYKDLGSEIVVMEGSERLLTATFDYDHRLTQLEVVVQGRDGSEQ